MRKRRRKIAMSGELNGRRCVKLLVMRAVGAVLPARRGEQENWSRLQLRVAAAIPYTESSPAEVGDFLADMDVNGKPSLETSGTYIEFIFGRRVCDGFGGDCREARSYHYAYPSQEGQRGQRLRRPD
jgi:hypothetical protein